MTQKQDNYHYYGDEVWFKADDGFWSQKKTIQEIIKDLIELKGQIEQAKVAPVIPYVSTGHEYDGYTPWESRTYEDKLDWYKNALKRIIGFRRANKLESSKKVDKLVKEIKDSY